MSTIASQALVTPASDDRGTTTAEYAVCTGAATGFAALLFKFLTSEQGQHLISVIFKALLNLLPF